MLWSRPFGIGWSLQNSILPNACWYLCQKVQNFRFHQKAEGWCRVHHVVWRNHIGYQNVFGIGLWLGTSLWNWIFLTRWNFAIERSDNKFRAIEHEETSYQANPCMLFTIRSFQKQLVFLKQICKMVMIHNWLDPWVMVYAKTKQVAILDVGTLRLPEASCDLNQLRY